MAKKKSTEKEVATRSWAALGLQHTRRQAFVDRKKRKRRGYRKHKGKSWD